MSPLLSVSEYLASSAEFSTVDVRSPGEYAKGHIPGAVNVPLFSDAERSEIGTLYKNVGRRDAMMRGLEFVGRKSAGWLATLEQVVAGSELVVHCWRGGMRSEGFAWFVEGCGFRTRRLDGGYKAYRQAVHRGFAESRQIIILAGATGSGKTQLLHDLRQAGEQVIDLEQLAQHRGSVFGGIQRPPQPTVEQFENELFVQWTAMQADKPLWIECESQAIGNVFIPPPIWNKMARAPAIFVEVPRAQRIAFLVEHYGQLPIPELTRAVHKIGKRLGGVRLQASLQALEQNDLAAFAELVLAFYDKAYTLSLEMRPRSPLNTVALPQPGQIADLAALRQLARQLTK